ncbi:MAG TPA: formate/nitrite transporter family protein [Stellaceae bacterium]|nr:formate/nitrite transporter family protein [Stellaceae bacterium]
MFLDTVDLFAQTAATKSAYLRRSPGGFFVSSMLAGAYVGLGIILIFSIGSNLDPGVRPLAMGASFAIALTLVIFAGSDLFTGHTMFMTLGWLRRQTGPRDLAASWIMSWTGNLAGCVVLAVLFVAGGGGIVLSSSSHLIVNVAAAKMNAPALELFARAILCNWLVCLAIWTSARMTNDTAKCIAIFWCLYAFIASGYEHSVANMTLLTIALLAPHPATVTWAGMGWNLLWVTLGNIVGGAGLVALSYWTASRTPLPAPTTAPVPAAAE